MKGNHLGCCKVIHQVAREADWCECAIPNVRYQFTRPTCVEISMTDIREYSNQKGTKSRTFSVPRKMAMTTDKQ